jgi:hypothetical protein
MFLKLKRVYVQFWAGNILISTIKFEIGKQEYKMNKIITLIFGINYLTNHMRFKSIPKIHKR